MFDCKCPKVTVVGLVIESLCSACDTKKIANIWV